MPKRLTVAQQRALIRALPASRISAMKKECRMGQQKGEGIKSILDRAKKALGPIAKEVGPKVMKEVVLPLLLKKAKEKAGVSGGTLRLAGQRGRGKGKRKKNK